MESAPELSGLVMLAGASIVVFGLSWYAILRFAIAVDSRSDGTAAGEHQTATRLAPVRRAARLTLAIWSVAGLVVLLVGWMLATLTP